MSEKRFVLYEHKENYYILKNPRIHLDFIEMLGDALTSEEIVEELNQLDEKVVELAEENEQLKKRLESSETTSDATSHYNAFLESKITTLEEENEQLKEELQRFKKYVFSEDNILCYKCEHCIKKDIYVVDCEMKGKVDVHSLCSLFREVKI